MPAFAGMSGDTKAHRRQHQRHHYHRSDRHQECGKAAERECLRHQIESNEAAGFSLLINDVEGIDNRLDGCDAAQARLLRLNSPRGAAR
jgi:hypothetical protein